MNDSHFELVMDECRILNVRGNMKRMAQHGVPASSYGTSSISLVLLDSS